MKVRVDASKSYDILIEEGALAGLPAFLMDRFPERKIAVITDDNVAPLYMEKVRGLIPSSNEISQYILPHGENSKNGSNYLSILNFLAREGLTRSDVILALGGGVVGDMAGFAAATYLRGIAFIQVATTLLAMVDSSVGGKTAIDLDEGKNLAGAFYQPELVICDYSMLSTLPEDVFRDGCAEVIKYGMIRDGELFSELEKGIFTDREKVIGRCIEIKRDVVNEDEHDLGIRQILNFGHTFGHSVEKCSGYSISHGRAVAIGMAIITRAAVKKGLCKERVLERLLGILDLYGLPSECTYSADELFEVSLSDKKRSGSTINLVIPRDTGIVEIMKTPLNEVRSFLEEGLA